MHASDDSMPMTISSPFGGIARLVQKLPVAFICEKYRKKCGADVTEYFKGIPNVGMYECEKTGYKFWRPEWVAGDEGFYHTLSKVWQRYYRTERWEYPLARKILGGRQSILEIGCGRGYFLQSIESRVRSGVGLELNGEAIKNKVTKLQISQMLVQDFLRGHAREFDAVCTFQVLEHVVDPCGFLRAALACLAPRGILLVSTPNNEYSIHRDQEDAFDLPPHHIGHFNERIYKRIADTFDLQAPELYLEPRKFISETVSHSTSTSFAFRAARLISKCLFNAAYAITGEPGANILVVFRKRVE